MSEREQIDAVLEEMQRAQESNASVMGRILNPVNRGYAVGVAGLVCFLPVTQCMFQVLSPIFVAEKACLHVYTASFSAGSSCRLITCASLNTAGPRGRSKVCVSR